ncbi:MAG: biosynthetic-type acetolactate synthase large subunit [Ruminococcus sp.]|nr:biosynthetic-type acetolactate synthase large subunit [Ruminococcus sp.]
MELKGAEIICECLLEQGVDTVFGYPGGAALNTYDALYKYSDRINHILTAHEQGASHAADGYARATGKTGVVITTSGPGATNIVTGLATAHIDSIPLVAITGNVNTDQLGRDSFQEVDIVDIVKPVTKASFLVKSIDALADTIRRAFTIANEGRKGPVLVDVPKDITAQTYSYEPVKPQGRQTVPVKNKESVAEALELIKHAERPIIYAGGGIISSDTSEKFRKFAELADAPVCCSLMGLGCIPADHRLNMGNIGMHGGYGTGVATSQCDLIIACGARFSDRVAGDREKFGSQAKIIQLDIDENEINKNVKVHNYILGDMESILDALCEDLPQQSHSDWVNKLNQLKEESEVKSQYPQFASPKQVIDKVNSLKSGDDVFVTDVGQHQMWIAQYADVMCPRTLLTSGGMGTMGFGMGAAIGAQTAFPDKKVILFTGDGSFHMNFNELVTLKSYNLPIIVIVMNNTVLGMVRQWQKLFYGKRFSQTDPKRATDFLALASAFGIKGMSINSAEEVDAVLEKAFALNEPVVIDCKISPDENVLPMIPPGKTVDDIIVDM